jgi:hypothetical protein
MPKLFLYNYFPGVGVILRRENSTRSLALEYFCALVLALTLKNPDL